MRLSGNGVSSGSIIESAATDGQTRNSAARHECGRGKEQRLVGDANLSFLGFLCALVYASDFLPSVSLTLNLRRFRLPNPTLIATFLATCRLRARSNMQRGSKR